MKVLGTRGGIPAPMNPVGGGITIRPFGIIVGCGERASGYGGASPGCGTAGGAVPRGGLCALYAGDCCAWGAFIPLLGGCPTNCGGTRARVCAPPGLPGGRGAPPVPAGAPILTPLPEALRPELVGFATVPLAVLIPTIEARLEATEDPVSAMRSR